MLIIGAGGLGCPAAIYLAGAGIGRLGIVDYDAVVNIIGIPLAHLKQTQIRISWLFV